MHKRLGGPQTSCGRCGVDTNLLLPEDVPPAEIRIKHLRSLCQFLSLSHSPCQFSMFWYCSSFSSTAPIFFLFSSSLMQFYLMFVFLLLSLVFLFFNFSPVPSYFFLLCLVLSASCLFSFSFLRPSQLLARSFSRYIHILYFHHFLFFLFLYFPFQLSFIFCPFPFYLFLIVLLFFFSNFCSSLLHISCDMPFTSPLPSCHHSDKHSCPVTTLHLLYESGDVTPFIGNLRNERLQVPLQCRLTLPPPYDIASTRMFSAECSRGLLMT